ncbi:EpsG family protein [Brumimicrobium mesophilum]|uniref:EpsG family protein n=1 Tax=Brumimicrobium mesophilum TaxID=392717 RepID=UPI000D14234B|nr:EpsG family protein [Brumimicrobium mesophilum]
MRKRIAGLGFHLLFILPVLGFLLSLVNLRSKTSAFVYVVFAMIFGYAISFSNTSADSYRYAQAFANFDNNISFSRITAMYQNGELRDMYRLLLFYIVSLISNNPKVLYAFAGGIYGVFSYLSLRIFVKERGARFDNNVIILAIIFFTFISLTNINGFRFHTGSVVLFYSLYKCIIQKKIIWVIGIIITPLFHYGFIIIAPVFVLYKLSEGNFYNKKGIHPILYYTFILTFLASWVLTTNSINLGFLTQSDLISGAVGERLEYINSSEVGSLVDNRRESSFFLSVQKYFDYGIKIYVFVVVIFMYKSINKMTVNKANYTRLLAFVLFFYSIAFVASSVPSGGRFLNIAHLFMILLLGKLYAVDKGIKIKKLILWSLPVFSFSILFINIMAPILVLSPTFWYANVGWIILEGISQFSP